MKTILNLPWKRTGLNEYPEEGQNCLIYFMYTGFSISKFEWAEDETGRTAVFSDRGGFLGDEDVLWIPLKDLKQNLPEDYANDRKFMKWDDPRKVVKKVVLLQDHVGDEGANYTKDFVPAGTELNITWDDSKCDTYFTATYKTKSGQLLQCFKIPKNICKDLNYIIY